MSAMTVIVEEEKITVVSVAEQGPAGGGGGGGGGGGVATGGSTGQFLKKNSGTDYDTIWATPSKSDVGLANADNTSDLDKPVSTATQTALNAKLTKNTSITGATKTKITYDANGLVTGGADATTADIADSTNKRYVTDAQQTVISGISGTNTGDQTITLTGDVTGSGTGSFAATIANDAVTYAKMQDISATSRVLGRNTAGSGDPEECTVHQVLDFAGNTNDRFLARQSGTWVPVVYQESAVQTVPDANITWTGTTAPSGTTNHRYWWTRVGKMVTVWLILDYTASGASLTQVDIALPSDCPTPYQWPGQTAANEHLNTANGLLITTSTASGSATRGFLANNAANNGFLLSLIAASGSYRVVHCTTSYRAA